MTGRLKNLKELNVSFNLLRSIPPELGDCENLEKLDCSGNLELTELPFEVRKQSFLHYNLLVFGLGHVMMWGRQFTSSESTFLISRFLDISVTLYQWLEGLSECSYTRPEAEFKFGKAVKKKQTGRLGGSVY